MGNIMTREAILKIMQGDGTPEERTEQVMGLYGRALDAGYIGKNAAAQAQETALAAAKAEWEKSVQHPDPKESDEYKALSGEFDAYKTMQAARGTPDYSRVKDKFFETVYGMVDRSEGAKPVADQLTEIEGQWGEYFNPANPDTKPKNTPQFSQHINQTGGQNPKTDEDKLFEQLSANWNR